jgi:hypothetical protein
MKGSPYLCKLSGRKGQEVSLEQFRFSIQNEINASDVLTSKVMSVKAKKKKIEG